MLLALLALPAAAALFFTFYTHEVWEDFLITFRHTENLVSGNGLVYQPGERVHGFTSVLNTLLPALPLLVFGTMKASLVFFRICSLAVLLGGLGLLWRNLHRRLNFGAVELLTAAVLIATSVKIIVFSMNGQETGLMVGFFAMAIGLGLDLNRPRAWVWLGLVWAGLFYSRPDAPLYIALSVALAWSTSEGEKKAFTTTMGKAAGGAVVLYAPWFFWAWSYYGSPIPHTVIAKASTNLLVNDSSLQTLNAVWSHIIDVAGDVFGPIYGLNGGWPWPIGWISTVATMAAALAWTSPLLDRFTRMCSGVLLATLVYLSWLRIQRDASPWYFGPACLLTIMVISRLAAFAWQARRRWLKIVGVGGAALLLASSATCFVLSNYQIRILQKEIDENTRKQIGLWLREHMAPGDTVFLEPIGYIGYYSGAKILDYPGLVSPEVVKARHELKIEYADLPAVLKPTWIVARWEEASLLKTVPSNVASYDFAKVFDSGPALDAYGHFAGELTLRHDAKFAVLHRKPGID